MRTPSPVERPTAVTIAGSDSGGGAGVQADLRTFTAHGVFGTSVVTSVTAQHTRGVESTHVLPTEELSAQIDAVTDDFDLRAGKTGMLATTDTVERVREAVADADAPFVVDPVMVAASGDRLLDPDAETAYEELIAESAVVTPNADEAAVLTGIEPTDTDDLRAVGDRLVEWGADAALVKGGHVAGDPVRDVLVVDGDPDTRSVESDTADGERSDADTERDEAATGGVRASDPSAEIAPLRVDADATGEPAQTAGGHSAYTFTHERIASEATHGSGCTLSSAIAARLARDEPLVSAVAGGVAFTTRAVRYPLDVGQGPGAVNGSVTLENDAARDRTREAGERVLQRLIETDVSPVVPEVGMNVVAATPYAERIGETAAVEGRITRTLSGVSAGRGVRFGASSHVARFLLAARAFDPTLRFAVNCRFDADTERAMDALEWATVELDRSTEPDPDHEGSTMGWAARQAMDRFEGAGAPDAVFDRGDVGKEPMVRVLGGDAETIADRVVALADHVRS